MKSRNTVWRPLLLTYYEAGATERWLEEMAARGLVAERIGFGVRFRRGAPEPARRFRAELEDAGLLDTDSLDGAAHDEKSALFGALGWAYLGAYGGYRFYTAEDPAAPEPHTDSALRAAVYRKRERRARRCFLGTLVAGLVLLGGLLAFLGKTEAPALWLCGAGGRYTALLALPFLVCLLTLADGWRRERRVRRRVEASEGLPPAGDFRRVRRRAAWREGLGWAALLALLILLLTPRAKPPLPPLSALGFSDLAALENEPSFRIESNEGAGYYEFAPWSPFAPWQHDILQWGVYPDGRRVTLQIRAYRTLPPALADAVYEELCAAAAREAVSRAAAGVGQARFETRDGWILVEKNGPAAVSTRYSVERE